MDISIIIVSYNTCALLRDCLLSVLEKTRGVAYEILVVDNASHDESCAMVEKEFPEARLIRNRENLGFSKANNLAIKESRGNYVLLLNSDTVLENNAVEILFEFMQAHPRAGACGPLLLNADKTVQRSIDTNPTVISMMLRLNRNRAWRFFSDKYHPHVFGYSKRCQIPDGWLTGAVLMIRKAVFPEVGLLDEAYFFMMEDCDWGLAVSRSSWETWFVPEAVVTHLLGSSGKSHSEEQKIFGEVQCLRQHRYYVRKNFGPVCCGLYRSVVCCRYATKLIRKVIAVALSSPGKRPRAIYKRKLAAQLLCASMEIGNESAPKDRFFPAS